MSAFDDFKPGDRVTHSTMGDGVIEQLARDELRVSFKNWPGAVAIYNRRWFLAHPDLLQHREAAAEKRSLSQ